MYVIVVGTAFGNKTIHGPFEFEYQAEDWYVQHGRNQPYDIVRLQKP